MSTSHPPSHCSFFDEGRCGSCTLLPAPYPLQLSEKERTLCSLFTEAGFSTIQIAPIVGAGEGFRTRNKTKMAVGGTTDRPLLGFIGKGMEMTEIGGCPLYPEPIPSILERVREGIRTRGMTPYDVTNDRGELKHVILRVSESTGEAYLRLVLRSRAELAKAARLLEDLRAAFPHIVVCSINFQPVRTSIIEGPEEEYLSERTTVLERFGTLVFPLSPQSFSQVTPSVAHRLYEKGAELVREIAPASLLDLFCGVGAFSLFSASAAGEVLGVELSAQAIENARAAAALNGISNCTFLAADALDFLTSDTRRFTAAIVNPPRRGLGEALVVALRDKVDELVLYSSCNPETLVRDLQWFAPRFEPVEAYPFDMFPHTRHMEVLVALRRTDRAR